MPSQIRSAAVRKAAKKRGVRKLLRDVLQAAVAVIAAGGTTAIVDLVLGHINNVAVGAALTFVYKFLVTFAQNYLEARGSIPQILPSPPVVTGEVTGAVTDATGEVIGEVAGTVGGVVGDVTDVVAPAGDVVGEVTEPVGDVVSDLNSDLSDLLGEAPKPTKPRATRKKTQS